MSTILKALSKHRHERRPPAGDPEAILDRTPSGGPPGSEARPTSPLPPWLAAVIAGTLGVAFLCVVATLGLWLNLPPRRLEPAPRDDVGVRVPMPPPASAPTSTPAALDLELPEPRPAHETVRLRTQPLLRSAPPVEAIPAPVPTPSNFVLVMPAPMPPPGSAALPDGKAAAAPTPTPSDIRLALRLTGIVLDPKNPSALINDEILRVGEVIEGAKVLAIDNPKFVRIQYQGKEYELELK